MQRMNTEESLDNVSVNEKIYRDTTFIKGIFYILFVASIITFFELIFFTYFIVPPQTHAINNFLSELSKKYENIIFYELYRANGNSVELTKFYNYKENSKKYILVAMERENRLNSHINNSAIGFIVIEIVSLIIIMIYIYLHLVHTRKLKYFSKKYSMNSQLDLMNPSANLSTTNLSANLSTNPFATNPSRNQSVNQFAMNPSKSGITIFEPRENSSGIITSEQVEIEIEKEPIPTPDSSINMSQEETIIPVIISGILTLVVLAFFQIFMYNFANKFKYTGYYGIEEIIYLVQNKLKADIG
jgi:hypothetical protein